MQIKEADGLGNAFKGLLLWHKTTTTSLRRPQDLDMRRISIRCMRRRAFGGGSVLIWHVYRPAQARHRTVVIQQFNGQEQRARQDWPGEITRAASGLSNRGRRGELQEASEIARFGGEVKTGVERVNTELIDGRHALPVQTQVHAGSCRTRRRSTANGAGAPTRVE